MPEAFDKCVKAGGRVVTKSLPEGHYIHGCTRDGGKNWVWGERKKKKETSRMASHGVPK